VDFRRSTSLSHDIGHLLRGLSDEVDGADLGRVVQSGYRFATATASSPRRSSAIFITSTALNHGRRERLDGRRDYLRTHTLARYWQIGVFVVNGVVHGLAGEIVQRITGECQTFSNCSGDLISPQRNSVRDPGTSSVELPFRRMIAERWRRDDE
jgi:hypothetical protein